MITPTQSADVIRAYHLSSAEHAISNVCLRRLKVARFSEVNDPFELLAINCMPRPLRQALAEFKNTQDRAIGLLSFSRRWKNPVLWSHYAVGGRGIALGFDIKRTIGTRGVLEVKYQDEKLRALDDGRSSAPIAREVRELLLVTKFKHWDYEEEVRVLVPLAETIRDGGLRFFPFGDDLRLREVILGPSCSQSVGSVAALVDRTNPGAEVVKSRLGFKYFEAKPDGRRGNR